MNFSASSGPAVFRRMTRLYSPARSTTDWSLTHTSLKKMCEVLPQSTYARVTISLPDKTN